MSKKISKSVIPDELKDVATTSDVTALDEKLGRCYSQDRYEEFQSATEKIIVRYLKGNVGWAAVVWVLTLIGSMVLQKFVHVF